ncbi:MAG TPA: nitrogenase component 1 [Rubrobacteraceae bacterium]|nr:nitrogenase component 1 [Rubrobacteraceae bacterium]
MTILNESGIPDVLPPLHAVSNLAQRLGDVLVVVAGTQAEAHLVQCLPAAPSPNLPPSGHDPRVVFAILDPDDPPPQGLLASRIVESAAGMRNVNLVLLVAAHPAEALGVDAAFEARLATRKLDLPVEVVDPEAPHELPGTLSTDLDDGVLSTMVDLCPKRRTSDLVETASAAKRGGLLGGLLGRGREAPEPGDGRPVVLLGGTLSPDAAQGLAAELSRAGVEVAGAVPADEVSDLPPVGEGTVVAVMDPNLTTAAAVAERRGATVVRTLMPVGVDGTARFVQDVSEEAGSRTSEVVRARSAWEDLGALRNRIRGKRVFFAGDTGFEIPLARFLADAGAVVLEVGAPRLDRRFLAAELQALGPDVDVVVSPDYRGQANRIDEARPDVVVCSPGLHLPLVARGHLCRSTQDFLRAGLYGYGGARRILELLARTLRRAETLDALNL